MSYSPIIGGGGVNVWSIYTFDQDLKIRFFVLAEPLSFSSHPSPADTSSFDLLR